GGGPAGVPGGGATDTQPGGVAGRAHAPSRAQDEQAQATPHTADGAAGDRPSAAGGQAHAPSRAQDEQAQAVPDAAGAQPGGVGGRARGLLGAEDGRAGA